MNIIFILIVIGIIAVITGIAGIVCKNTILGSIAIAIVGCDIIAVGAMVYGAQMWRSIGITAFVVGGLCICVSAVMMIKKNKSK